MEQKHANFRLLVDRKHIFDLLEFSMHPIYLYQSDSLWMEGVYLRLYLVDFRK